MNTQNPWRGLRVALRFLHTDWPWDDVKWRWSFMWERGVVVSAENGIAEVTLMGGRNLRPIRVRLNRLTCCSCCGMGRIITSDEMPPVKLKEIDCPDCKELPRVGPRWVHPKDEWGEAPDTDPTGAWLERHKQRIERINKQTAAAWKAKQEKLL